MQGLDSSNGRCTLLIVASRCHLHDKGIPKHNDELKLAGSVCGEVVHLLLRELSPTKACWSKSMTVHTLIKASTPLPGGDITIIILTWQGSGVTLMLIACSIRARPSTTH